jgi:hypothetical protein
MGDALSGRELSRAFYDEIIAPLVGPRPHAAALIGYGSDVLGFDDTRSTDHGFGPRLQLFVDAGDVGDVAKGVETSLPATFRGWPVRYGWDDVPARHHVEIATPGAWLQGRLGADPTDTLSTLDWLAMPQQRLAEVTGGPVFHDGPGDLTRARAALDWYPHEVWLYLLASQWQRISQEEAFVGRTAETGDDLGSRLVAARIARDLVRLCFLLERRYPPYMKWLGSAFARLESAGDVGPALQRALSAAEYDEREAGLALAYGLAGKRQNALGITSRVDPEPRRFYGRPYLVSAAVDFVSACRSRIEDPWLRTRAPVGGIDQVADSTDLLSHPRAASAVVDALFRAETVASSLLEQEDQA